MIFMWLVKVVSNQLKVMLEFVTVEIRESARKNIANKKVSHKFYLQRGPLCPESIDSHSMENLHNVG